MGRFLKAQFRRTPVMLSCLALSILGAAIVEMWPGGIHWLTFQDFIQTPRGYLVGTATEAFQQGQYWRLVTPIFLHFGIFHIAFNGLWLWEFGRRIEDLAGSTHFLLLVLLTGIGSNLGQYLWQGPSLFGGMSGVIYGLLGYIWVRNSVAPHPVLALPPGILGFMLFWLVLGMTGVIDLFMQGSIANAAHGFGLVIGLGLGWLAGMASRRG